MKKFSLIGLIVCFVSLMLTAQNYQTVSPNSIAFFKNTTETQGFFPVNSLRIDSIHQNENLVLFPFKNIQQIEEDCYTPFGASWIGNKIIVKPDGANLYFNKDQDTILIQTGATLGEMWEMYHRNDLSIFAEISSVDTLHFLGLVDTVKTISLQAYNALDIPVEHQINNFELKISKQFGWIRTCNFYLFPDIEVFTDYDYQNIQEYVLEGLTNPQVGVQNLTWFDVYDFNIGDEIHISSYYNYIFSDNETMDSYIYKYLNRTDYPDSIVYEVEQIHSHYIQESAVESSYQYIHDTIIQKILANSNFNYLPNEPIIDDGETYSYDMALTPFICKIITQGIAFYNNNEIDSCWMFNIYDGCYKANEYLKGLGGPYYYCGGAGSLPYESSRTLVYFRKGAEEWGTPLTISEIDPVALSSEILVYPNPVTDIIQISLPSDDYSSLEIINSQGQCVLSKNRPSKKTNLNLKGFAKGVYLLRVIKKNKVEITRVIKI